MESFAEVLHLDGASIAVLEEPHRFQIVQNPYSLLAGCGWHFTAPSLSIEKGSKAYIAISCEWFETPHSWADYWRIVISETSIPKGIEVRSDGALVAPCTISLYNAEPISSIEVHSNRWDWSHDDEEEHVEYDSALLFHMTDSRVFCVWCHQWARHFDRGSIHGGS
jgi:hypothetical protein